MKKIIIAVIAILVLGSSVVYAAPYFRQEATIVPISNSAYDLGTTSLKWRNIYIAGSDGCLTLASGLISSTASACGSGSAGGATSTNPLMATYFVATSSTATSSFLGNMTVTGTVGIGTITPDAKLSVVGDIVATAITATSTFNTSGTTGGYKIDGNLILQASSTNSSTLLGRSAGAALLSDGLYNTTLGFEALKVATSSDSNTAVGYRALYANTTGAQNSALGRGSLQANTTGSNNTAMGYTSLYSNITGAQNTASGMYSLYYGTSTTYSTAIGYLSGVGSALAANDYNSTVDTYMTFLGASASRDSNVASTTALINATAIGYNAKVGGSNMLVLGNAANVGIGTSSPSSKLHVTVGAAGSIAAHSQSILTLESNTNQAINMLAPTAAVSSIYFGNPTYGSLDGRIRYDNTSRALDFWTANAARMIINASGNVGIGTTSPLALFTVSGGNIEIGTTTGSTVGNITINGRRLINTYTVNNGSSDQSNLFVGEDAGNYTLSSSNGQNAGFGYQVLTGLTTGIQNTVSGFRAGNVISSGNLNSGIGGSSCRGITTGSYNTCLGASTGYFGNNNGAQNAVTNFTTNIGYGAYSSRSNSMVLGGLALDYTDVVIGTSTPFARFGIQAFYGSTTPLFDIASTTSTGFATTSLFRVTSDGNVGIGTSSPWRTLSVTGTAAISGLTTAAGTPNSVCINSTTKELVENAALTCTVSDRNQKSDILPLAINGMDTLMELNPVSFEYNDNLNRGRWGFIAQDLQAVDPKLGDGYREGEARSIDQPAIMAVTVKAVQELNQKVNENAKLIKQLQDKTDTHTVITDTPTKESSNSSETFQWIAIGLLALGFGYQSYKLKKLTK